MKYVCAQGSRQGGRAHNEDRVALAERDSAVLMVLGDGLGGHKGGGLASATLCQVATQAFRAVRSPLIQDPSHFLAFVIFQTHHALRALGQKQQPPILPRTTCVLSLVQEGCAYWAHIGDSRLYHFHHDHLLTRTQDDTTVEAFRQRGILKDSECLTHPDKSRLLACLGGHEDPVVSLSGEVPLKTGDVLLLCSDGVWEAMEARDIGRALTQPVLENGLADLLWEAESRRQQAADNISAICLRWQDQAGVALHRAPPARRISAHEFWERGQKLAVDHKIQSLKNVSPKIPF